MKLLKFTLLLMLVCWLMAPAAAAQQGPKLVYFFVTAEPSILERTFTPVLRARVNRFDEAQVFAQYCQEVRRTLKWKTSVINIARGRRQDNQDELTGDWFRYAHHGRVYGPFDSEASVMQEYDRTVKEATTVGRAVYPRELGGFKYHEASVILADLDLPAAGKPTANPAQSADWRGALARLPVTLYGPDEYTWAAATTGDRLVPVVADLQSSTALIVVDASLDMGPGSRALLALQDRARLVVDRGLNLMLIIPGRTKPAADAIVAKFVGLFATRGKRLEVVAPADGDLADALRARMTSFLSLPSLPLTLNELMANNVAAVKGPEGDFPDWLEVFNAGRTPLDLSGMYLNDKDDTRSLARIAGGDPAKTTVQPGSYLVLWLDDRPQLGPNHIALRLSSKGEHLSIVDVDGTTVIDDIRFGDQAADKSFARMPDGRGAWRPNREPTPGAPNK
jgi:hypothetical protein